MIYFEAEDRRSRQLIVVHMRRAHGHIIVWHMGTPRVWVRLVRRAYRYEPGRGPWLEQTTRARAAGRELDARAS